MVVTVQQIVMSVLLMAPNCRHHMLQQKYGRSAVEHAGQDRQIVPLSMALLLAAGPKLPLIRVGMPCAIQLGLLAAAMCGGTLLRLPIQSTGYRLKFVQS